MQSGDREPLEGIAEEPPTEESTANRNAANFAQELLDYSQELEELYSASESLGDTAPMPQTATENADVAAAATAAVGDAEPTAAGQEVIAASQEDVADNADVAAAETAAMEAAETVSQEVVEEMCDKGRPILIQLVKAAVEAGPVQPGLGKLGIAIAGHLGVVDLATVIGIAIAGVECGHELHSVQGRIAVLTQQEDTLKLERDTLAERVAEAELLAGSAESQLSLLKKTLADEREEHASVLSDLSRHTVRIRELEEANAKLEAQSREARRTTMFDRAMDAGIHVPLVATGVHGGICEM